MGPITGVAKEGDVMMEARVQGVQVTLLLAVKTEDGLKVRNEGGLQKVQSCRPILDFRTRVILCPAMGRIVLHKKKLFCILNIFKYPTGYLLD